MRHLPPQATAGADAGAGLTGGWCPLDGGSYRGMSDCTEPRPPEADNGRNGEGQEGMRKVGTA